ncbi:MAG: hypothetical protein EOO91_08780 [Pedobacter sp.]|nr:MAG: hypothetical protein EOO91_08780 [Pedobacter sp.]
MKLNADSLKMDSADAKFLIVPGKSIGKFYLGQNVIELDSILGKPDLSDAAMGKAWSIWYRGDTSKFNLSHPSSRMENSELIILF